MPKPIMNAVTFVVHTPRRRRRSACPRAARRRAQLIAHPHAEQHDAAAASRPSIPAEPQPQRLPSLTARSTQVEPDGQERGADPIDLAGDFDRRLGHEEMGGDRRDDHDHGLNQKIHAEVVDDQAAEDEPALPPMPNVAEIRPIPAPTRSRGTRRG